MKQIWNYLNKYIQEHFHLGLYLSVALFLTLCTYFNFAYDFEDSIVDSYQKTLWHWFYMTLFMGFPFLAICVLLYVFDANRTWLRSKEFWLLFLFGFVLLGFSRTLYFHYSLIDHLDVIDYRFARKVMWRGKTFFTIFIPLMLFYYGYENKKDESQSWYGLTLRQIDFKPYGVLLLLVVVGIGLASFMSDLTNYYPRYIPSGGDKFAAQHDLAGWIPMLIYEGVYGANFLNVELFFRGFLVIGFVPAQEYREARR